MRKTDLQYHLPESLIALKPAATSRIMLVQEKPSEISQAELLDYFSSGDCLVLNNTKVLKRRVFVGEHELLFLSEETPGLWQILFPSRHMKLGDTLDLPEGVTMTLIEKGRPQKVRLEPRVNETYFERHGELPLPPYIQKNRGQRRNLSEDDQWYQTSWAQKPGSFAAPTASLHFQKDFFEKLSNKGVRICYLTLHIGLGTFLPVSAENLSEHQMHSEFVEIPYCTWEEIQNIKNQGGKIWAMGTTVTRALESASQGILQENEDGFVGSTSLLIYPPYRFQVVDRLMTNFHQPESTLLALVSAFAGLEQVKVCYQWAIERNFRWLSYGDLSVWIPQWKKG